MIALEFQTILLWITIFLSVQIGQDHSCPGRKFVAVEVLVSSNQAYLQVAERYVWSFWNSGRSFSATHSTSSLLHRLDESGFELRGGEKISPENDHSPREQISRKTEQKERERKCIKF